MTTFCLARLKLAVQFGGIILGRQPSVNSLDRMKFVRIVILTKMVPGFEGVAGEILSG